MLDYTITIQKDESDDDDRLQRQDETVLDSSSFLQKS